MKHPLRFYVLILPNLPWPELVERFRQIESLGFDLAGFADHFVDWGNPPGHWYELWTWIAGIAQATDRIRLVTTVAQIPLRDPATQTGHRGSAVVGIVEIPGRPYVVPRPPVLS